MKFFLVSFFSFLAIVTAEVHVHTDGRFGADVLYDSRNIKINLNSDDNALLTTSDFSRMSGLQAIQDVSRIFLLGPEQRPAMIDLSRQTMNEIGRVVAHLRSQIAAHKKQGTLDEYKKNVKVYEQYIQFSDPSIPGLEIVVAVNGLAYLKTPSGVIVQVIPTSLKVAELNGMIKEADLSAQDNKNGLGEVARNLAEEAFDWVREEQAKKPYSG